MRPLSWLLGVAFLAGLALPAVGQDKLPVEGKAGDDTLNVDEIIRDTVAVTNFQPPVGPGFNFEAGGEFLLLRPHFDDFSNGGVFFSDNTVVPQLEGFDAPEYDLEPAFRIWLAGVIDNGFGVRVRYFRIAAESELLTGVINDPPFFTRTETLATGLEMDVVDAEGTVQRAGNGWFCLAAAGIRYARLKRTGEFTSIGVVFGEPVSFTEHQEADVEGLGPTFALEGRRSLLGSLDGFLAVRGSLVIGDNHTRSFGQGQEGGIPFTNAFDLTTDASLWVGEVQFGLEWARQLNLGEVFLRAALEAQYWLDGAHILEGGGERNGMFSPHDDLTLLGLLVGAGIRR